MKPDMETSQMTAAMVDESMAIVQRLFVDYRSKILSIAGNVEHTSKHYGSPVTELDVEIEKALQAALLARFPTVPVYGEETGYPPELLGTYWLVDPIDSTIGFITGEPTFTNMAVLIQDEVATAAVIYNPTTDEMYTAQKDMGAFKNKVRLDLRTAPLPNTAWCKGRDVAALDAMLLPLDIHCSDSKNGGGYGFTQVADGQIAARFQMHSRGQIHDYAPGALLIKEAGGEIIDIHHQDYSFSSISFVACHPLLAQTVGENRPLLIELDPIIKDRQFD